MSPVAGGRFCNSCKRTVRDYSNYSRKQLNSLKENSTELCGNFSPHQIDSSLIPVDDLIPKKSIAFASVLFLFGLGAPKVNAQVTDSVSIEKVDSTSCDGQKAEVLDNITEHEKWVRRRDRRRSIIQKGWRVESGGNYSTYISWRFPFIVRRPNFRGRF